MKEEFTSELNMIEDALSRDFKPDAPKVREALSKARSLAGLTVMEAMALVSAGQELTEEINEAAAHVKRAIYGERLVFFAPIYISNYCVNDCRYCGFHAGNSTSRKKMTRGEIISETRRLVDMGHKRLLLESGEDSANNPIDYVCEAIEAIYSVKTDKGEIRRINVNIAATSVENLKKLKSCGIGTYQLFQETYHRRTYEELHRGPKADYMRQLGALDNAFEAGIDDVGIGALFGLHDWRFETLSLIAHAAHLSKKFGVGPHTISVPRFRPANYVDYSPENVVSDRDFLRLIAILRVAVPYAGMIITTRETPEIRRAAFQIGITQASAASRTAPAGQGLPGNADVAQFETSDKRTLNEIAIDVMRNGFTPSFCTACYRKNRTGQAFMDLAKPGDIQEFCTPNGILTLQEYIEDIATPEGRALGEAIIRRSLDEIRNPVLRRQTEEKLELVRKGKRDVYF